MNLMDLWGAARRRWYAVVVGVLIAVSAGIGVWSVVPVEYTRTATQLLLPGASTIPEGTNPFLYVGGLSQSADVLARRMSSPDVLGTVEEEHPDVEIAFARDEASSSWMSNTPVMTTTVTATSDAEAALVLDRLLRLSDATLDEMQRAVGIGAGARIELVTLTVDDRGDPQQSARMVATGVTMVGVIALTLFAVALLDRLVRASGHHRGWPTPMDAGVRSETVTPVYDPVVEDREDAVSVDQPVPAGPRHAPVEAAATPAEKHTEKPARQPAKRPARQPAKRPARQPAKNATEQPVEQPAKPAVKRPAKRATKQPAKQPAANEVPVEKPPTKPPGQSAAPR